MENYHSKSLTTREKTIIILGMVHIANEDGNDIDSKEGFAIEFNANLLQMTMDKFQDNLKKLPVFDDQMLFRELENLSYDNKKFVVRAFISVANSSPDPEMKKLILAFNILNEDMGMRLEEIESIVNER